MATSKALALAGFTVLLSGCATTPQPHLGQGAGHGGAFAANGGDRAGNGGGGGPPPTPTEVFSVARYIGVDATEWNSDKNPQSYSDLYTRIELEGPATVGAGGGTSDFRDYNAESRPWLLRILSNETKTVTLIATISGKDPAITVAIPLASATYSSGPKAANTWATNFTASDVQSPLFRIGPNTGLTIHLDAKVSSDVKSQGAALTIAGITKAVKIAAPSSTLLTTLSASEVENTATAIDTTLSAILSQDITEEIALGRLTDSWKPRATINLAGCIPFVRFEGEAQHGFYKGCARQPDLDHHYDVPIGNWTLMLTCPRPSAFDGRDLCQTIGGVAPDSTSHIVDWAAAANRTTIKTAIAHAANDAQILSFQLSSQVDVQTFVQSQDWYSNFVSNPTDYGAFCEGAITGMEKAGLSQFDSALVLRAMIDQMPKITAKHDGFVAAATGKDCLRLLGASNVDLAAGAPAPAPVVGPVKAGNG